ncbi:putative amidoligase [Chaetomium tenue]|uniref:Amidoligase n=1 Tax=Chaetomium tenue TaxID=1854479 RepID=A0ACB7P412_9PEZI|nr:putative amidoligase [Chaetomium globosum]
MSTSTAVRPIFTFGIEIEILVKPKKDTDVYPRLIASHFDPALQPGHGVDEVKAERNRTAIRRVLAGAMTNFGIETSIAGNNYEIWDVKREGSLNEVADARGGGYWAIELVSRILSTDNPGWAKEVNDVFETVWNYFDVQLTKGCSMHVHVAPKPKWEMSSLRDIMKATGVFDDAITKIMPASRKANPWARSNFRDGPEPTDKAQPALKKAFDEVPSKAWGPLFALFDSVKMRQAILLTWGQDRNVSWNLAPLSQCGTIEFRRPPGVRTAVDAQKWATFAVAFVCAATATQSD